MRNNVKIVATALIGAGLLAGCSDNNAGETRTSGRSAGADGQNAATTTTAETVTLGGVTLPKTVAGYAIPDCASAHPTMANNTTRTGEVIYMETGLQPLYSIGTESCFDDSDHQAKAISAGWRTVTDAEASLTLGGESGWQTVGDARCSTAGASQGIECDRLVGNLLVSAGSSAPLTGTSYKNWHQPTNQEVVDVLDAVAANLR